MRECRIFFRAQFKKNWIVLKISENSKKHRKLARLAETVDGTFRLDTRRICTRTGARIFLYGIGSSLIALNLHARRVHSAMPRNLLRGGGGIFLRGRIQHLAEFGFREQAV